MRKLSIFILIFFLLQTAVFASQRLIQPVTGNIDNSTIADETITTSFDGNLYAWKSSRTLLEGNWPVKFDGFVCAEPALVNLDNNLNDLEILVPVCDATGKHSLYGLQGSGNIIGGWIRDIDFPVYSGPVVSSFVISGEARDIVFIGSQNGYIYAYDLNSWDKISGWPKEAGSGKIVTPIALDINNDGNNEIIATSGSGNIVIFEYSGEKWEEIANTNIGTGIACKAVVADINNDSINELIVATTNGSIYAWNFIGKSLIPSFSVSIGTPVTVSPVIMNIDEDEDLEIVCISSGGNINLINNDGAIIDKEFINMPRSYYPSGKTQKLLSVISNKFFFSQSGSYFSNVYKAAPEISLTEWGRYHHSNQPMVIELSSSPDPFSPNEDKRKDSTSISAVIGSSKKLSGSLSVYNNESKLIKTLKTGEMGASEQHLWDGRSESGSFVTSETYTILLNLESATSDRINQINTVVVDTEKPFFISFEVVPKTVSPSENVLFDFSPSEPSQLSISIMDNNNQVYKTHFELLETTENYSFEWDGKGDQNQIFSGSYSYVASLEDMAGNLSSAEAGIIIVDVDAPFVNGVYPDPEIFSTKSYINRTNLHYAIPEDAFVSLNIYNSEKNLAKTILNSDLISSGAQSSEWDGSDNGGSYLPDGHYTFKVEAVDINHNVSATVENTVEIDNTPPSLLQISAVPEEFSSGSNSVLSFFLSESADLIVEVANSSSVIKIISSEEAVSFGAYSFEWDGKDIAGDGVADGEYAFRIIAVDAAGNEKVVEQKLVINSIPPEISGVAVNPNLFTPNSSLSNSWAKLGYTLSGGIGGTIIDINVLNSAGITVKTIIENEIAYPGNYSEIWYGDLDIGGYAKEGEYSFEITVVDGMGNEVKSAIGVEVIENPEASVYLAPEIFSPSAKETTTIFYNVDYSDLLSGNAQVWINIHNSGGSKVYEFIDSVGRGNYTHVWDGSNNRSGGIVTDGVYQVKVEIEDPEGNKVVSYSNNIVVDSIGPEITINGANPNPFIPNKFESTSFDFIVGDDTSDYFLDLIKIYDESNNLVKTLSSGEVIWDGTVDSSFGDSNNDGLADEGTYTFRILATDEAGNGTVKEGSVLVNRQVLHLTEPANSLNPVYFSPSVVPDTLITYTIGQSSSGPVLASTSSAKLMSMIMAENPIGFVSIEVLAQDDSLIKTLIPSSEDTGERDAGTYQVSWDGRDEAGLRSPDGHYKIVITAFDYFGNPAESLEYLNYDLVLDVTPPTGEVIINGGEGYTNQISVEVSIAATDELCAVTSMKLNNNMDFDLVPEENFIHLKSWEIQEGPDGERTVYATLQDQAGNWSAQEMSGSIILDTKPPVISDVYSGPQYFSPGNSFGIKDSTDIYYSLDESASVVISIEGVGHVSGVISSESGESSQNWDPGGTVSEGTYYYTVYAWDIAGNSSETTGMDFVVVDNTPPTLQINNTSTESGWMMPFNPYSDLQINAEYILTDNLSLDAYVSSNVTSTDGSSVKQLLINDQTILGTNETQWDGTNLSGNYVDVNDFILSIIATDEAGNSSAAECLIPLRDDQKISNNLSGFSSIDPLLDYSGSCLNLMFINGSTLEPRSFEFRKECPEDFGGGESTHFILDFGQVVSITRSNRLGVSGYINFEITNSNGDLVWSNYDRTNGTEEIFLPADRYRVFIYVGAGHNYDLWGKLEIDYIGLKYNYVASASINELSNWIFDNSQTYDKTIEAVAASGNITHYVWPDISRGIKVYEYLFLATPPYWKMIWSNHSQFSPNDIIYNKKINGEWRKMRDGYLANSWRFDGIDIPIEDRLVYSSGNSINPSVAADEYENVYVVWEDWSSGRGEVFYKKSTDEGDSWSDKFVLVSSPGSCRNPSIDVSDQYVYLAWQDNRNGIDEIFVNRSEDGGQTWINGIKITNNINDGGEASGPSIVVNDIGDAYVAWEDTRTGQKEIYFQKIPENFEPLASQTPGMMYIFNYSVPEPSIIEFFDFNLTLECISPVDESIVQSLRPTFKWSGLKNITDYRIECAAASDESSLANTFDYFTPTISYGQALADNPVGTFTIPDHQTGLDENESDFNSEPYWYWRVKAISSEVIIGTSEVESFRIYLPLSISGVINYPNPFDSNKENTKIRYKLGSDADNVVIRIYDITGALVKELEGDERGEGSSIWDKYNEVEWDGRNGRGDRVVNGVYPFEVVVSSGSKKVSGRGKIVVLK